MAGILEGKRLLVTGVITDASIAFHVARIAQEQGAQVVLTGFGRMSLVQRIAQRLPEAAPVIELDVTSEEDLAGLPDRVLEHMDGIDGVLHSIGFAPASAMGGNFLNTSWEDVSTAVHVSAYSLKSLTVACLPLMQPGGAVVGLTFDATVAWPTYDWMGVAKAAFESTARYLARDVGPKGIRVNLVAAGPIKTMAARVDPRLRRVRRGVDDAGADRLGPGRPDPDGAGLRRAAVRLVPEDHRGDRPRRRWGPRHRCVSTPPRP